MYLFYPSIMYLAIPFSAAYFMPVVICVTEKELRTNIYNTFASHKATYSTYPWIPPLLIIDAG